MNIPDLIGALEDLASKAEGVNELVTEIVDKVEQDPNLKPIEDDVKKIGEDLGDMAKDLRRIIQDL